MIVALIERIIQYRIAILVGLGGLLVLSAWDIRNAPLDAIPDISDPQIVIYAKWPRSPQLLESELTEPIVNALLGSPLIQGIRATSNLGYSFIYVLLEDENQRATVRQIVNDRINAIRPQLPGDAVVTIGPNASSMGWIYQYALVDRENLRDLRELRLLNEGRIKPLLQGVSGIAEVASVGGLEKQFQLKVYPPLLAANGLTLDRLIAALQSAFPESGGRTIEVTNRAYELRGVIDYQGIDDLEQIIVGRNPAQEPIRLKDIGYIQVGYDQRRGIADLNGEGEVVGGIVIMEHDQNVLTVTQRLKQAIENLDDVLPAGVEIVTTYDRSQLISDTVRHFLLTLLYELAVVIALTIVFLRNLRIALAPVAVLLLGTAFTALPLSTFGQTINLLSLAGLFIAIGEMVDATIVIIENCTAELAARGAVSASERRQIIIRSIANVIRPLFFSLLIILASFMPVFFLSEKEGRLFDPLAYTKTFAMMFSTFLTIVLLPIIVTWAYRHNTARKQGSKQLALVSIYKHLVLGAVRFRYAFVALSAVLVVFAGFTLNGFRKDFMPEMEEGSILFMPTTLPGVPGREAGWILQQIDRRLSEFPEVASVFGKLGRADTSTDPAPMTMIESTVLLKPEFEWREGMTKDALVAEMDEAMQLIGYANMWVQPVSGRVVMQDTGIQTPVGLKVKGDDLFRIEEIGRQIEGLLSSFPGTQSVIAERISSGYFIDVQFDPGRLAEYGIPASEASPIVRYGIGGDDVVGVEDETGLTVPLNVQYSPEYIDTLEKIRNTPIVTSGGDTIRLGQVADVAVRNMPDMIRNDNGQLTGYVYIYLGAISAIDYVEDAREYLAENLDLPPGYSIEWTGDYQYAERAQAQLRYIVPFTLVIIFLLLLAAFKSVTDTLLIMFSVPFAMVGGIFLQWILGYSMTTAVIIGYIALFAVAIQTGIIMIIFIRHALAERTANQTYMEAVLEGSVARLRPKLMTVGTTILSLIPIMILAGPGIEIMRPIATPTVGGMVSSTIYVLILIPCLFAIGEDLRRIRSRPMGSS